MKLTLPSLRIQTAAPAHRQIAAHLEQMILRGELAPSTRLPPATELAREWNASYVVIHKALAQLTRTGLLERKPRRGTFVRQWRGESVIGILMDPSLSWEATHVYRKLAEVLQTEVPRMGREGGEAPEVAGRPRNGARRALSRCRWVSRVYDCLGPAFFDQPCYAQVCQRLREDLRHFPFRGWIHFGVGVDRLPFRKEILRMPIAYSRYDALSDTAFDQYDFASQTVSYLAGLGCRRIGYLRVSPLDAREKQGIQEASREHGAEVEFIQARRGFHAGRPHSEEAFICERETTEFTVKLVEQWRRRKRAPDGLVVWEDIGMRAVAMGLFKSGVLVPGQLRVVSQANEGIYLNYAVPVARYEVPVTETARQLVRILWKRMNHEDPGPLPVMLRGRIVPEAEKVIA